MSAINKVVSMKFCLAVCLLFFGCGDNASSPSTPGETKPAEDGAAVMQVLDEVFFVAPSNAELRTDAEYVQITDEIARLKAQPKEGKELKAWVYYIQRDNQWWADSVHENADMAFNRQNRLINAKLVDPADCRVNWVYLDAP